MVRVQQYQFKDIGVMVVFYQVQCSRIVLLKMRMAINKPQLI